MSTIEKIQTFIILFAVTCGIVLGQFNLIHMYSEQFIVPFLFFMLYGLFLSIPLKEIKNGFRNLKFAATSLTINFVWTPLLAWGLGALFLSDHPALWVGFIMLMVTPCTDWYLIFTEIAKGNVALSTAYFACKFNFASTTPSHLLIFICWCHEDCICFCFSRKYCYRNRLTIYTCTRYKIHYE